MEDLENSMVIDALWGGEYEAGGSFKFFDWDDDEYPDEDMDDWDDEY